MIKHKDLPKESFKHFKLMRTKDLKIFFVLGCEFWEEIFETFLVAVEAYKFDFEG